jgi:hypothetical protein
MSEASLKRFDCSIEGTLRSTKQAQALIVCNEQRTVRALPLRPGFLHQLGLSSGVVAAKRLFDWTLGMDQRVATGTTY